MKNFLLNLYKSNLKADKQERSCYFICLLFLSYLDYGLYFIVNLISWNMIITFKIKHWIGLKYSHIQLESLSFIFIFFMASCTNEASDSFISETFEAGISRRSMPVVVTICIDAYITIGGGGSLGGVSHTVYKGTTCRTCLVDEQYELNPDEYEAGGFPDYGTAIDKGSGGGGGNGKRYYVGDKWEFNFSQMAKIYASNSNLNAYQKGLLENVISKFNELYKPYPALYDRLVKDSIRINFKMDTTIIRSAGYKPHDCSISFKDEASINCENLAEEIIHAVQHQVFYGKDMDEKYKNFEFEAKVFHDFVYSKALFYDNLDANFAFWATMTYSDPLFVEQYQNWICECAKRGCMPSSEFKTYNDLCKQWKGYPGEYKESMTPKLLEFYFRKADPPIKPNNNEY